MCVAIPGKVIGLSGEKARIEFNGEQREVYTEMVMPKAGDWVLVYGNQVMEVISREKAREILESMRDI